jgi:hypothetical protein
MDEAIRGRRPSTVAGRSPVGARAVTALTALVGNVAVL